MMAIKKYTLLGVPLLVAFWFYLNSHGPIPRSLQSNQFLSSLTSSSGQNECHPVITKPEVDDDIKGIQLHSYSYCGGILNATAFVQNTSYRKEITLYFSNRLNITNPLTTLALRYHSDVPDTKYEYWNAAESIYLDGVDRLLNLTYHAADKRETFTQILNIDVTPSGKKEPRPPTPPKPYASPMGLQKDITQFFSLTINAQTAKSKSAFFANIHPDLPGVADGTVVAARSGPSFPQKDPNYEYDWVRDAALVLDTVVQFYNSTTDDKLMGKYETLLFQYAKKRAQQQKAADSSIGSLGEPKFYLNNTLFTGPWGRPQNDGPATSAITLMNFADVYLAKGHDVEDIKDLVWSGANAPVKRDLLFVVEKWSDPDFDLWEEVKSQHFYTRMMQVRALRQGSVFATRMGDNKTSYKLAKAASEVTATLDQFWEPNRRIILYEYGPVLHNKTSYKDVAISLAVNHARIEDFDCTDDRVLASLVEIATSFLDIYHIAKITSDRQGLTLGIPIGRYPEDVYNGYKMSPSGGNPWYLATASLAETFYRIVKEYKSTESILVTNTSLPFFQYFAPKAKLQAGSRISLSDKKFNIIIDALLGWGDAFIRRIKHHTPTNGRLFEQYNSQTGKGQGAADLTWSNAAFMTVGLARAEAVGDDEWVVGLADMNW